MALLTTARRFPGPRTSAPGQYHWRARVRLVRTWSMVVLTLVALGFVAIYGSSTPRWEDWFLVPYVTGAETFSLSWLWGECPGTQGIHPEAGSRRLLLPSSASTRSRFST